MIQPINGQLLVEIERSKYGHVNTSLGKEHENAVSTGVVIAVASDCDALIEELYYKGKVKDYVKPSSLVGKKVRWVKFAERNSSFDGDATDVDEKTKKPKTYALLTYKDLIGYES